MGGAGNAHDRLARIRVLGVRVAIDGVRDGDHSLADLRSVPVDVVEVERRFVQSIQGDRVAEAVVRMVTSLAEDIAHDDGRGCRDRHAPRGARRARMPRRAGRLRSPARAPDELRAWIAARAERPGPTARRAPAGSTGPQQEGAGADT